MLRRAGHRWRPHLPSAISLETSVASRTVHSNGYQTLLGQASLRSCIFMVFASCSGLTETGASWNFPWGGCHLPCFQSILQKPDALSLSFLSSSLPPLPLSHFMSDNVKLELELIHTILIVLLLSICSVHTVAQAMG